MYKLLVIDDEEHIRQGIIEQIDWNALGMGTILQVDNGKDALSVIRQETPEFILSDIRMPGMNGLDLLETLRREKIPNHTVFLSGFDDFAYTRRAMQLNAFDYLLKPIDPIELEAVMRRMIQLHESELRTAKSTIEVEHGSLKLLQRSAAKSLLTGNVHWDIKLLRERLYSLQLEWMPVLPLVVMVIELDSYKTLDDPELLHFAVGNVLEETVASREKFVVYESPPNRWVAMIGLHASGSTDSYVYRQTIVKLAETIMTHIRSFVKHAASIGVSQTTHDWTQLPQLYKQANAALEYKRMVGGGKVILHETLNDRDRNETELEFNEYAFLTSLLKGRSDELQQQQSFVSYLKRLCATSNGHGLQSRPVVEWVMKIHRLLEEGRHADIPMETALNLWESIDRCETVDEVVACVNTHFISLCDRIIPPYSEHLVKAIEWIKANLHEKLTLQQVADVVHVSPMWLSQLFRNEANTTFLEYVTDLKMEKAKSLLLQDNKVFEASEQVGYQDIDYFTKLFRRHTGMTPKEFQKKRGGLNLK